MTNSVLWWFCFLLIAANHVNITIKAADDILRVLSAEGYRNEIHSVITADKYILKLHRIPSTKPTSRPVLLVHGLGSSSFSFVITGPGIPKPLAFRLADHGYDIWLINCRGTEFSQHQNILTTSPEFWKFSFHEIAKYDLPAIIDYVLSETNRTFLHYVGHSQGTTTAMAMLSMLPQYNKKIKTLHLMAPSVYFGNAAMPFKTLAMFIDPLEQALTAVRIDRTWKLSPELVTVGGILCNTKSILTLEICKLMIYTSTGRSDYFNQAIAAESTITNILRNTVQPVSAMQILHYGQLVKAGPEGAFRQFDHKKEKNLSLYNQSTPPLYELSNVKTKIHFLYGTTDQITNSRDAERLISEFKHWTIGVDKIDGYNHLDFVAAINIEEMVNSKILNLINRHGH